MSVKEMLIEEIEHASDNVLGEVLDFVRFLRSKGIQERSETAIASESSLAKDWLRPEEDEAWRDL